MNKTLKVILLSALVYPGTGHFILKKYATGSTIVCAFTVILYFIIRDILLKVNLVVERVKNGEIPLDLSLITEEVSKASIDMSAQGSNVLSYLMIAVIVIWMFAIWDSYRASKLTQQVVISSSE